MIETLAKAILRWRYAWIVLILLFVAWAASGVRFLEFTSDYRVFFSDENPQLTAFETLQNTYTHSDNVLIVIAPKNKTIFDQKTLPVVEALTLEAWQLPYSLRVDSISNFQHTTVEADDLLVADLIAEAASLTATDLQRIKTIALNEPLLINRLISPTADITAINVTIQLPGIHQDTEVPEVVTATRDMVDRYRATYPELDFYLTGAIMLDNAFPEAAIHDMTTLVPLMFLIVFVCLWLLLRSVFAIGVTLLVVFCSILTGMGLAGWMGINLTPPTSSAPTIILTLAIADCVHILVPFLHNMFKGMDKNSAMIESLRVNIVPVTLTSLTTAIGFLSMNFSDSPPFRDLGNIVAMGVVAAWIYSCVLMPVLVTLLPIKPHTTQEKASRLMGRLGDFVLANRNLLFWGNLCLIIVLALSITRNEFNDQFIEYFDKSIEFRSDTDFVINNLTGLYSMDYSINTGDSGSLNDPQSLASIEKFTNWLREQPEVVHVNTITDIIKRLNKNLHNDDDNWYRIPESRELAAQYLLLYEMSLPFGLDLNNQINIDKSATRITVILKNLTSKQVIALEERTYDWLVNNAPPIMAGHGASPAVMFSHIAFRNIHSMLQGNLFALVIISCLLIFAFRSIIYGLVSLVPNVVPAVMAFGIWGLLVGEVGLALSIVVSMTLGIVVDDTIHFMSKYLRARRELGLNSEEAIRQAFSSVGVALMITSIVLILGFLVLSLSSFRLNAGMGLLTAITIGLALLADFLFLPPLLLKISRK
ncbi:MAG: MMPL family transporter [Gammaproteobacteria bacterium]